MQFSNQEFKRFRERFKEVVEPLQKEFQISIDIGNINYNSDQFTSKITCINLEGEKLTENSDIERVKWDSCCEKFGLTSEDFGKEITIRNRLFKVVGIAPNARKNCILIEEIATGKVFKTSTNALK